MEATAAAGDLTGMPDLITLAYLARTEGRRLSPRWVRQVYGRHANKLGAQWSDAGLVRALTAFADATGLHPLRGADQ
ncbi:hypothetical protein ACFYWN_30120 [Streptomyces sp. NPDC002917]|uniref:hypothetical protein n=1 Tax=Streptomyces sp. NPDC002917 TaxID=3364671 RepID=UPI0036CC5F74